MLAASIAGTVPSWILVAFAVFVAWRVSSGGAGSAVSELTAANAVLERSLTDTRDKLGAEVRDLRIENGELRGRTDVAIALMPVIDWTAMHEQRAQDRHVAMMKQQSQVIVILASIADRLGPEPNGNGEAHE